MSDEAWSQVVAALVGVAFTVLARLIDRWLPDEKHPLPKPPPSASTKGDDAP